MRSLRDLKLVRELLELRSSLSGTTPGEDLTDSAARYELAVSTRRFSKKAKDVVDDKLAFSATLMRAGEVEAASRLLEEVEEEVRHERAALMRKVDQVKTAQHQRKERMTRMRLARTLAVAVLGSTVMAFSAIGMSLASFIGDRDDQEASRTFAGGEAAPVGGIPDTDHGRVHDGIRKIRINGRSIILTKSDLKLVEQFANGAITQVSVQEILQLLPDDVARVIVASVARADKPAEQVAEVLLKAVKNKKRKNRAQDQPPPPAAPEPEPSEAPSPQPSDEPSPSPSPSKKTRDGSGGGSGSGDGSDDGDSTGGGGGGSDGGEGPLGFAGQSEEGS